MTTYKYISHYGTQQIELNMGMETVMNPATGNERMMPVTKKIRLSPSYTTDDPEIAKLIEEHPEFKLRGKIERDDSNLEFSLIDSTGSVVTEEKQKKNELNQQNKLNQVGSLQSDFVKVEEPKEEKNDLLKEIMSKLEALEHENKELKGQIAEEDAKKEQRKANLAKARAARKKKSPSKK